MAAISVLMPTYNASKYVAEAIKSVLQQSFEDWELIIVDDGSIDNTNQIIRSFTDKRIKLICNKHDFACSQNIGLKQASGKYVARMDADDIMHPDRLKIQYKIMEEEPEITVCGSWIKIFGNQQPCTTISSIKGKITHILRILLKQNPIYHPTTMIRNEFLKKNFIQYGNYKYAADYKLWFDIARKGGCFFIESQPLLFYRVSDEQVSHLHAEEQQACALQIRKEILLYWINNNKHLKCISLLNEAFEMAIEEKVLTEKNVCDIFDFILPKNDITSVNIP